MTPVSVALCVVQSEDGKREDKKVSEKCIKSIEMRAERESILKEKIKAPQVRGDK